MIKLNLERVLVIIENVIDCNRLNYKWVLYPYYTYVMGRNVQIYPYYV
jgi:hypothetical protein